MSPTTSANESQEKLRAKNFRILVTDDEPMLRSVITEYLEAFGWTELAEASNGIEALETIRSNAVDCLLSDIRMPMMDLEELGPAERNQFNVTRSGVIAFRLSPAKAPDYKGGVHVEIARLR